MPNALAGPAGAHRCTSVPDLMLPFSSTFSLLICCSVWSINWSIFEGLLMRPDHADNATMRDMLSLCVLDATCGACSDCSSPGLMVHLPNCFMGQKNFQEKMCV